MPAGPYPVALRRRRVFRWVHRSPRPSEIDGRYSRRKLDVIVVYKVDRLTRSLADFAKLVELFDAHGVSFVSVTQQFNTTTSMGRLTLNVLLSFAQFEREVTSSVSATRSQLLNEKAFGSAAPSPLVTRWTMVNGRHRGRGRAGPADLSALSRTWRRQCTGAGSPGAGRPAKSRLLATGATRGGILFGRGSLFYLLRNRFYIGEVKYKEEILPGEQPAIMDRALFDAVQQRLTEQWTPGPRRGMPATIF